MRRFATTGLAAALLSSCLLYIHPVVRAEEVPTLQLPVGGNVQVVGYLPTNPPSGDHRGRDLYAVDLVSDQRTVYPTAAGVIAFAGGDCERLNPQTQLTCYGYTMAIDHGDGLYSIYTHLSCASMAAADNDFCSQASDDVQELTDDRELPVDPAKPIGIISDSGCFGNCGDNGAHLHFAIHQGDPGLRGTDALWLANTPVNVWAIVPGLPNPPSLGPLSTVPAPMPIVAPPPESPSPSPGPPPAPQPALPTLGSNIIPNSSFELGYPDPIGWQKDRMFRDGQTLESNVGHTGDRSVAIAGSTTMQSGGSAGFEWRTNDVISLRPGATYQFSVWAKAATGFDPSTGRAGFEIWNRNFSYGAALTSRPVLGLVLEIKPPPGPSHFAFDLSTQWRQFGFQFNVTDSFVDQSSGAALARVSLQYFSTTNRDRNKVYFDDVALQELQQIGHQSGTCT